MLAFCLEFLHPLLIEKLAYSSFVCVTVLTEFCKQHFVVSVEFRNFPPFSVALR